MNGLIQKNGQPDEAVMEKINRYTRRPYKAEEVYTFSVVLCDNEVDRDFECFTIGALEKLAELFVGKTGILDHDHSSRNQSARVFDAAVKRFPDKLTALNQPYAQLTAQAYIPRNAESAALIESIDSGIRKEVSVGCAVKKRVCSVCGREGCTHVRGRMYEGKPCVRILDEPTDAYEFSFVAVPAQRAAGVVKQFSHAKKKEVYAVDDIWKCLETEEESVMISGEALAAMRGEIKTLKERAEWGERYRESLCAQIRKHSAVAQPQFSRGLTDSIVKKLSIGELEEMTQALGKMAQAHMPVAPQLAGRNGTDEKNADDRAFRI